MAMLEVKCRRCGEVLRVDDEQPLPKYFPFCTERCRLIDLGRWFDEDFKVSRHIDERDIDEGE